MKIRFLIFILTAFVLSESVGQDLVGAIQVNSGATVTSNPERKVNIALNAVGATQMMVSNDGSFIGRTWEEYRTSIIGWRLSPGEGLKTIYAKFRDGNGNISEVVEAQIEFDRTPPENPEIVIDLGRDYTNDRNRAVTLELGAIDADKMRISNSNDFKAVGNSSGWGSFQPTVKWKLAGAEGKKTVYVQFMDIAGNMTEPVSDEITLDYTAPTNCRMTIEGNEKYTRNQTVKIAVQADGASEMIVRGGDWMPFQKEFEWDLGAEDGEKVLFMKFKDEAGNTSAVVSANIILDTQPPLHGMIRINDGSRYTQKYNDVHLKLNALGASHMKISNSPDLSKVDWRPFATLVPAWPVEDTDGKKEIYVQFKDAAGNETEVFQDHIILDKTPPGQPFVRIQSPDAVYDTVANVTIISNNARVVDLKISAQDADYMMVSNISTFYGAKWEAYKETYKDWELGGANDGERIVFVKFRDKSGNVSVAAQDKAVVDTQAPVDNKIIIDNNAQYCTNPDKNVALQLFSRGASHMMISNDPTFEGATWEPYQANKNWQLGGEDGIATVLVRYKDLAGNESDPEVDNIILDRKPPFDCSIIINKGEKVTNHPDKIVLVKVKATDAVLMQVSNEPSFNGARWRGYTNLNFNHSLSGGDGLKTIYVRFKDEAGNISEAISDEIELDRTPPKDARLVINEGMPSLTNNANKKVELSLYAEGAVEMKISNLWDLKDAEWEPFQPKKEWLLIGPDGLKTVYGIFRDKIGNETRVAYDRIGVDRQAPKEGRITINEGAEFCTSVNGYVNLKLYAVEAKEMMLSNNKDFEGADWMPYEYYYQNWMLEGEDGEKKVYVKFRDEAKNETQPIVASIFLDRQEPVGEELVINNGEKYTNDKSNRVNLEIRAEGATEMMISNSNNFRPPAKWEPYKEQIGWTLLGKDGTKVIYVKFRDKAGNESAVASSSILLDTEAPIPQFTHINDSQTSTDKQRVLLTIKAKDAQFMMVSNHPRFEGAIWEPYQASKAWDLTEGDGLKRVFVKFKDEAQNESGHVYGEITLYSSY